LIFDLYLFLYHVEVAQKRLTHCQNHTIKSVT